jgi:hypothetical protein
VTDQVPQPYKEEENYTLLGAFTKLRKTTISFIMSVHPSTRNISASTGRIFMIL